MSNDTSSDDSSSEIPNSVVETTRTIEDYVQESLREERRSRSSSQESELLPIETHTRLDAALSQFTDESLQSFISTKVPRAESTLRKEAWVLSLYTPWCIRTHKRDPFPLESENVCAFLRFMAIHGGYALSGIKFIVVPALKHLHLDRFQELDAHIRQDMSNTIRALSHDHRVTQSGAGKPPLCSFDVAELIHRIPDGLSFKAADASLFLFALHTGARAITCEAITYDDLMYCETDEKTKLTRLVIMETVTKGNDQYNHPVCIEGYLHQPHDLDAVFWLNQYVHDTTGKNLEYVCGKKEDEEFEYHKRPLWPLTRDSMRERLKKRLMEAGFPPGRWSFHSLRSGHICSCLLFTGSDTEKKASVLELTAIVAGWKPYGKAQRRYIKAVAERTIVSSRLIGAGAFLHHLPTEESSSSSSSSSSTRTAPPSSSPHGYVDSLSTVFLKGSTPVNSGFVINPNTTEEFHLIKLNKPHFGERHWMRELRSCFNAPFYKTEGDRERQHECSTNAFNAVLVHWARCEEDENTHSDYKELLKRGRTILMKRLIKDAENIRGLADEMLALLPELGYDPARPPPKHVYKTERPAPPTPEEREMLIGRTGKKSRKRFKWTREEDAIILKAKRECKSFKHFMDQPVLHQRSVDDCGQRWKVIVSKMPYLKQINTLSEDDETILNILHPPSARDQLIQHYERHSSLTHSKDANGFLSHSCRNPVRRQLFSGPHTDPFYSSNATQATQLGGTVESTISEHGKLNQSEEDAH